MRVAPFHCRPTSVSQQIARRATRSARRAAAAGWAAKAGAASQAQAVALGLQTSGTVVMGRLQPSGTRGGASMLRGKSAEGYDTRVRD